MNDKHDSGQNTDSYGRWRNPHSISAAQFEAIERAAKANGVELETVSFDPESPDGPPLYIWQKDHILVSSDVDEKSNEELRRLGAVPAPVEKGLLPVVREDLVKLLRLDALRGIEDRLTTRQIVEQLNVREDLTGKVFVNNLMYVTHGDGANLCPASEPVPLREYPHTVPYPPYKPGDAGGGVRIVVIDTGLPKDGWKDYPWLYDKNNPSTADLEMSGSEESTYDENGNIAPHAGHGMFIAGLIRCVAPRATVKVLNTLHWAGTMSEAGVALEIMKVLDEEKPDIISLSAGFMIHNSATGGGPGAMLNVMERLTREDCHTVLVAATGNDGHGPLDHGWFYPAAFAADKDAGYVDKGLLVAVGALRQDRAGRACFSNYDEWVTVYEEGENLVNAFPRGRFVYNEPLSEMDPPRCVYYPNDHHPYTLEQGCTCLSAPAKGSVALFNGMAMWSGTSFATPIVAARIARHMTKNPKFKNQPRAATQDLLGQLVAISDAGDGTKLPVFPQPAVP